MAESPPLDTGRTLAFIGLGQMGAPMARRLLQAGYRVRASDMSAPALEAFVRDGGEAFAEPAAAAAGADILITMLPNGKIVREVLLGAGRAADALNAGALVIDMSSSAPFLTRETGAVLSGMGRTMIDAPVSGGVGRAVTGELAIMAGGEAADIERAGPVLSKLGQSIFPTGPLGSGHAMKALNNYVSAAGLTAACEAVLAGSAFGLDPNVVVDVLNASTGRNNATDKKLKPFVLSGAFNSGFSMALMAKDIRTAEAMIQELRCHLPGIAGAADFWEEASATLGAGADHTNIFSFLQRLSADGAERG